MLQGQDSGHSSKIVQRNTLVKFCSVQEIQNIDKIPLRLCLNFSVRDG